MDVAAAKSLQDPGTPHKQKMQAEFLGTFILVFMVGLVSLIGNENPELKVFGGTAIACTLAVMMFALGKVSGGHFNPAVSFTIWQQCSDFTAKDLSYYVFFQCLGGLFGGLASGWLHGFTGAGVQPDKVFWLGAPLVEFLYTAMICFVFLNVAVSKALKGKHTFGGIAVGFVIIAGYYGGSPVSGGSFNPAVAFGREFMKKCNPMLALGGGGFECSGFMDAFDIYLPIYWAAQLAGGFVACTLFHIVRPEEKIHDDFSGPFARVTQFFFWIEEKFDKEDTAEFIGSFYLCLTISLNGILSVFPKSNPGGIWSIAASYMCMHFAVGDVSGGLFNPALTVSLALRYLKTGDGLEGYGMYEEKLTDPRPPVDAAQEGKHPWKEIPKYILAQLVGGAAGSGTTLLIYLCKSFYTKDFWPAAEIGPKTFKLMNGTTAITQTCTLPQAFFAETFGTFLLCFVVLAVVTTANVRDDLKDNSDNAIKDYTSFAIGSVIVGAGYAWGPFSGGVLNPAVTLATAICNKLQVFTTPSPTLYFFGQLFGGALAAGVYRLIYAHKFAKKPALDAPLLGNTAA
jgi:aquaporin Z